MGARSGARGVSAFAHGAERRLRAKEVGSCQGPISWRLTYHRTPHMTTGNSGDKLEPASGKVSRLPNSSRNVTKHTRGGA